MSDPFSRLVNLGEATSHNAAHVTFNVPQDFIDALDRLSGAKARPAYDGKEDADARGNLQTFGQVRDFFYARSSPDDIRALAMSVDVELIRHDVMLRNVMLLDLWRRTARKQCRRRRVSTYASADPFDRFIIHETAQKQKQESAKEPEQRTPKKRKRSVYYLTQLFQYAVRRMVWERRRLANSSDPWDLFFYRAYTARKPVEEECARRKDKGEKRRVAVQIAHDLESCGSADEARENEGESSDTTKPPASRRSSILVDPATLPSIGGVAEDGDSDVSSDADIEIAVNDVRRPSLSEQMLKSASRQSTSPLPTTSEVLILHSEEKLEETKLDANPSSLLTVTAEKERIRRPSITLSPSPSVAQQKRRSSFDHAETKTASFAVVRPSREAASPSPPRQERKKASFLPPIRDAKRDAATSSEETKSSSTRSRPLSLPPIVPVRPRWAPSAPISSPSTRMRFGRPPRSPDGRNNLTRLFYLPLLPPRSSHASQWAGNDIDRVIRALAT